MPLTAGKYVTTNGTPNKGRQTMQSDAYGPSDMAMLVAGQLTPSLTGLTGGTATDLDGVATASLAVGLIRMTLVSGELGFYELQAGTDAESSPDVIRPDDYAASANEKIWKRVL